MKKRMSLPFGVWMVLLVAGCDTSDPKLREPHLATLACRNGVKGQLASPATAVFPMEDGSRRVDDKTIKVESWVESKNTFGATMRRHFSCTASVDSGKVKVDDVTMQD